MNKQQNTSQKAVVMMTVKYRISCLDSELLVKQTEEANKPAFRLGIQHNSNPLGFGYPLGLFRSEEEAIMKATYFCTFYRKALERGYHLKDGRFVKPGKPELAVDDILRGSHADRDMARLLNEK